MVRPVGAGGMAPTRLRRRANKVDHDAVRAALGVTLVDGRSVTEVAKELRVDLSTLLRIDRDLYLAVRNAAAERRAQEEELRHFAAIDEVEGLARALVQKRKRLTHRNARSLGGGSFMPSGTEAAVLSVMRFGLGDGSARPPATAMRLGPRYIRRIHEAIARLRAEVEGDQLQLHLDPG